MQISDIRVRLNPKKDGPVRAFVSFLIDGVFAVHDVRVLESANGLFVAMPDRKRQDGQYIDIVHPINAETREQVVAAILAEYRSVLASDGNADENADESAEEEDVIL